MLGVFATVVILSLNQARRRAAFHLAQSCQGIEPHCGTEPLDSMRHEFFVDFAGHFPGFAILEKNNKRRA
jgi:hypothetical protein